MSSQDTDTPAPYERPREEWTMNSVLEAQADHRGEEAFVHYGPEGRTVTYGRLNRLANAVGNSLRDLGVERGDRVSVMLRHPLETLVAMFGIHKAGAVYSPVNFEYKGQALSYQLDDTDPELLLVEGGYTGRLNDVRDDLADLPTVVVREAGADAGEDDTEPLDDDFERVPYADLTEAPERRPDVALEWHDEASIVYTSGTTGKPKGVVLPHRWIFSNYTRFGSAVLNEEDVTHTSLPLYHVGGVYFDVVSALVSGGEVSLWDRFSPEAFWDRVEEYEATKATLLSVMIPWLMDQPEREDDHRNTLTKVHMQPLPAHYDEIAERFAFDFVTAGFGQTESGNPLAGVIHAAQGEDATPTDVRRGTTPADVIAAAEEQGVPVVDAIDEDRYMGHAVDHMEVAVLDDHDQRLPPGEVGELAVRPQVAGTILDRYYGKPEKTAEALAGCWFHTGDAAYRDEAGNFYFVDRIGDVIRRRGENISSIQVQDAITGHEQVAQAAAFPVPAEEGGEDLVGAAVEPTADADLTEEDVLAYLREELPSFMVPDRLLVVEEIPTTETNKMEKYKLRQRLSGGA